MHYRKYEVERRQLIQKFGDMKMKLDFVDLFQKSSRSVSAGRIVLFNTPWFLFWFFFSNFGAHSIPNGGGNAPFRCLKTANRNNSTKKNKLFCFFSNKPLFNICTNKQKDLFVN